jgi:iduronate 2-sulfatase
MPQVTSEPVGAPEYAKTNGGELRNYTGIPSSGAIDESTTRQLIHGYYAATSYTDAQIGKVLDALKQLELDGNTIVILWGDHGWHLGDHGMWCKHTNYEQATRIPIIVSAPDGARSKASSSLIETVDVFPTVCELSGLSVPAGLDGQSFAAVVRDPSQQARSFVTHVYPRGERLGRAIRTDQYRMVEWKVPGEPDSAAEIELYDYANDPQETKNIADQEPKIVGELRELLAAQGEAKPQWKAPKEKRRGS